LRLPFLIGAPKRALSLQADRSTPAIGLGVGQPLSLTFVSEFDMHVQKEIALNAVLVKAIGLRME